MTRKRSAQVIVIAILIALIIVPMVVHGSLRLTFKEIFGFNLPESVQKEGYKYVSDVGGFWAKITVNDEDMEPLKENFYQYFGELHYLDGPLSERERALMGTHRGPGLPWWDLNKDDIWIFGMRMTDGQKNIFGAGNKTRSIHVFITRPVDGQWVVYIVVL